MIVSEVRECDLAASKLGVVYEQQVITAVFCQTNKYGMRSALADTNNQPLKPAMLPLHV